MDDLIWKKDENPYVVFKCAKCKQYIYVKTIQKTKKCLRCGRSYQVNKILKEGEVLKGIVNAMNRVKQKQNDLALEETGANPDLRAINDFFVAGNDTSIDRTSAASRKKGLKDDYDQSFNQLLVRLSKLYHEFPEYLIKILGEEFEIPDSELKLLIRRFVNKKNLIPLNNNYYKYVPVS